MISRVLKVIISSNGDSKSLGPSNIESGNMTVTSRLGKLS
jgi:hypothetical protein